MENRALLRDCCEQMGVSLGEKETEQFMTYLSLLLEWNEKMNLTAITEPREVVLKHFADCLSLVPCMEWRDGMRVIDVGTGAGFPGIPVKIACPEIELTLLDSLQKRIGFLQEVGSQLGLEGVHYVHSRAEDGGQNPQYREGFDLCVSRAVANLSVLAEYCLPFLKVGGRLAALKGPDAAAEAEQAEEASAQDAEAKLRLRAAAKTIIMPGLLSSVLGADRSLMVQFYRFSVIMSRLKY